MRLGSLSQKCFESNTECGRCDKKDAAALQRPLNREDDLEWPPLIGLRHPASASCLGRHSRLAGRCPNNSSLFPPLAAVVVVASHVQRKEYFYLQFRNACGRFGTTFSQEGAQRGTVSAAKICDLRHAKRGCCAVQQPLRVTLQRLRPQSWDRPSACGCWT